MVGKVSLTLFTIMVIVLTFQTCAKYDSAHDTFSTKIQNVKGTLNLLQAKADKYKVVSASLNEIGYTVIMSDGSQTTFEADQVVPLYIKDGMWYIGFENTLVAASQYQNERPVLSYDRTWVIGDHTTNIVAPDKVTGLLVEEVESKYTKLLRLSYDKIVYELPMLQTQKHLAFLSLSENFITIEENMQKDFPIALPLNCKEVNVTLQDINADNHRAELVQDNLLTETLTLNGQTYVRLAVPKGFQGTANLRIEAVNTLGDSEELIMPVNVPPVSRMQFNIQGVDFDMLYVAAGNAQIGSKGNEVGRGTNEGFHKIAIEKDYYIAETEVTQKLFQTVLPEANTDFRFEYGIGADCPAYNISLEDLLAEGGFLEALNAQLADQLPDNMYFTLPTETQWEYAARGGHKGNAYHIYAGNDNIDAVACSQVSKSQTIKTKQPNEIGAYDMSGNVAEWCLQDDVHTYSDNKTYVRGGSWLHPEEQCRVANRISYNPNSRLYYIGFRLALVSR